MICQRCSHEFNPPAHTAQLMRIGRVNTLCPNCEVAAPHPLVMPKAAKFDLRRSSKSKLFRVDWFEPNGIVLRFIALPPLFKKPNRGRFRRLGRRDDQIYAFVMSETAGRLKSNPNLVLRHNLENFQPRGQPLRIEKIPNYATPLTGVDVFEIPQIQILKIEDTGSLEVNVHLKDGGRVWMRFRNT